MILKYPCDSRRITSPYGPRTYGDKFHDGIDFGALVRGVDGDTIYAAHDGVVKRSYLSRSYGNCVVLDSPEGFSTIYGHMTKRSVVFGQSVKAGEKLGEMGSTGDSTGVHLHFELRNVPYEANPGTYYKSSAGRFTSSIDPLPYLAETEKTTKVKKNNVASAWARRSWLKASSKGVFDGTNPTGAITREQVAVALDRLGLLD